MKKPTIHHLDQGSNIDAPILSNGNPKVSLVIKESPNVYVINWSGLNPGQSIYRLSV